MRGIEHIPWLYDLGMTLLEPLGIGRLRRRLIARTRGKILEVGCGTGRNLPLYPAENRPVALEIDLRLILTARRQNPSQLFVVASVESLPFRDRHFDTVVSSLVFCSVPNPQRGLLAIQRVLKPDGRLWMLEHVRAAGLLGYLQDRLQPFWTWLTGGCRPNRDTERRVEETGFTIEPQTRLARGVIRFFAARPSAEL